MEPKSLPFQGSDFVLMIYLDAHLNLLKRVHLRKYEMNKNVKVTYLSGPQEGVFL